MEIVGYHYKVLLGGVGFVAQFVREGPNAHDVFIVVKSGNDVICCHYVAVATVRIT